MDLEQTLVLGAAGSVRGGAEAEVIDSDVVMVCASAPLRLNSSRLDPLCAWVQRRTGLDRRRVLGYTLNDSLRLRTDISQALDAAHQSIDAWVIGEHGDSCVPLFSRMKLAGAPVALTAEQRGKAEEFMRSCYVRHVALDSGRSSTWTSGLGVARMVASIAYGKGEMWPASVVLAGEYGIDGVSLSVPVSLGRHGAEDIREWEITPGEYAALQVAATRVREVTNTINVLSLNQTK